MRERAILYGGKIILEFDPVKHAYFINGERVEDVSGILGIINKPSFNSGR